jgi:hypothetical protein
MSTWCVWARLPSNPGWSRIATGISEAEARRLAAALLFPATAMSEADGAPS